MSNYNWTCICKTKNKYGVIVNYKLMDPNGHTYTFTPDQVKHQMRQGMPVSNLKFTSDGRLVDKKETAEESYQTQQTKNAKTIKSDAKKKESAQQVNPMQFISETASGLVQAEQKKAVSLQGNKHTAMRNHFMPENMGAVYSKFEEIIEQHPHNPWRTARETDKMNWTRIIWKRWLQDNNTDIVFEITKVIQNYQKTLPKHRYNVTGYGHYSIDKDKFVFEDTVDNVKYDYSMLCRAVKNYCDKRRKNVRPDIIEDWVLNLTAQAVDADTDDDIEEIVQSLMNESYID